MMYCTCTGVASIISNFQRLEQNNNNWYKEFAKGNRQQIMLLKSQTHRTDAY